MNATNPPQTTYYTGMKAVYTPSPLTAKQPNPLFEALPPFEVDTIEQRLTAGADFFDPAWRTLNKSDRLLLLKQLEIDMYLYRKRDTILATGVWQALGCRYLRMSPLDSRYFIPGGRPSSERADNVGCFGRSDTGKTNSLRAVLKLIPEVICHDEYQGKPMEIKKQVPILRTVCPTTGGAVNLYDGIIAKFCSLTGAKYPRSRSKTHGETMIMQILETAGIGAIAVDEVSNVLLPGVLKGQILAGFTRLNEEWGIPLILAGEENVAKTFENFFHAARRSSGLGSWSRMKYDTEYHEWFRKVLSFNLTEKPWDYTPELADFFYRYSDGLVGAVVKGVITAQQVAIENGHKAVRRSDLEYALKHRNDMQSAGLKFLKDERALRVDILRKARENTEKAKGRVQPDEEATDLSAVKDVPRPPLFGEDAA